MPSTVALAGLSWLASLLAFAAIHRLAAVHAGPAAATWAVWFVALSPGALSLVLGYSDAFYLAALAWALVFAGQARWGGGWRRRRGGDRQPSQRLDRRRRRDRRHRPHGPVVACRARRRRARRPCS